MEIAWAGIIKYFSFGILGIYILCLIFIFIYSLTQLNMLRYFISYQKKKKSIPSLPKNLPFVTIQLPIYNELYVVERLIECITKLNYPKGKIQIQVLDDSTDESLNLTRNTVLKYQKKGSLIEHITRVNRENFKAGALKNGLKSATGEFIAIFDADFLPQPDWLLKTIPYFDDVKIGVVQTRWGHLNRNYSVLTKIQAFALDAHFLLEQIGRNQQKFFINFNGTAGVWRKKCILDAGNWEGDTLTEDLDISYRAQLKKWEFKYLDDVITPAELPITLNAIRSQQFRWNKGGAENFKKNIGAVFKSSNISIIVKFNALFHLLNSTMFLNVMIVSILSVPILYIKNKYPELQTLFNFSILFVLSTLIFFICYWFIHKKIFGGGLLSFMNYIKRFLMFYSLIMGFSVHNSIAVLEGHWGKKSPFIRTPKFNITQRKEKKINKYNIEKKSNYSFIELGFSLYFLFGLISAFGVSEKGDFGLFPFHLLLFIGFGSISYFGLKRSNNL